MNGPFLKIRACKNSTGEICARQGAPVQYVLNLVKMKFFYITESLQCLSTPY